MAGSHMTEVSNGVSQTGHLKSQNGRPGSEADGEAMEVSIGSMKRTVI